MCLMCATHLLTAQVDIEEDLEGNSRQREADSLYITEIQDHLEPDKVLHAEPLYIDLIRDLGARKGEKEWNVGLGLKGNERYDEYTALVEYEFAPINRLGLEIEFPFSFYYPQGGNLPTEDEDKGDIPRSRLDGLQLAGQYSFFVSEKLKTTLAIGYLHRFIFPEFRGYGRTRFYEGNEYSPFFIAAKRWGQNFHTLVYTGPVIERFFDMPEQNEFFWQINTSLHYMIPGTRNFIGVETNQHATSEKIYTVFRPQMRVSLADNLIIGIVTSIPVGKTSERLGSFVRLIYEPGHISGHGIPKR
ncbi:MAG: phosphoribosylformylglycinamidine synthase [Bernardetiaceae bacterium]|nr:phosphoribosylformylglycinamidine synthase [Bernardetiaceae bacterium]